MKMVPFVVVMGLFTLLRTGSDWFPGEHAEWKDYPDGETSKWIKLLNKLDDDRKLDRTEYWQDRWDQLRGPDKALQHGLDRLYTEVFAQYIAGTNLFEAQIVALPEDWLALDEAEKEFRAHWANREGHVYADPFPVVSARDVEQEFKWALAEAHRENKVSPEGQDDRPTPDVFRRRWALARGLMVAESFPRLKAREPEKDFEKAWQARRKTYLDAKPKPDLKKHNLRHANLAGAFLPGVKLESARLEGADLSRARLEGADLSSARLKGANLFGAGLEGAKLSWARLGIADLRSARLEGANLRGARLEGADLRGARLEGADLFEVRLEGANLADLRLEGIDLRFARLEGANLSGARLERADLVEAYFDGANLSRADLQGADLSGARLTSANLSGARLEGANLRSARLVGADLGRAMLSGANLRRARLEGVNFLNARLKGADLTGATLEGADMRYAKLEGAELSRAWLFGAKQNPMNLNTTNFNASRWVHSALRFVKLDGVNVAELQDFDQSFGDGSVKLPDGVKMPARWCRRVLDDAQFFGRLRGYVDPDGDAWFDEEFNGHPPIPPPSDAALIRASEPDRKDPC